ncbi:MAG: methyltransferase domain-containing protein, partial [Methylocystis sp.]
MNKSSARSCPLCGGAAGERSFPYATRFNGVNFDYWRCQACSGVFVDPIPDTETFAKMYAKSAYHDVHYVECESPHYRESAALLTKFLPAGASVLDYGCGLGLFLRALDEQGFSATGVEFDREAAEMAAKVSRCPAYALEELAERQAEASLDALHLGDVLEHLGDPAKTLDALLSLVKPGGLLFVEGPLENNSSPVYWSARFAGAMKRFLKRGFVGSGAPTHLLRVDGAQQQAFF